jgi:hypothetical protein
VILCEILQVFSTRLDTEEIIEALSGSQFPHCNGLARLCDLRSLIMREDILYLVFAPSSWVVKSFQFTSISFVSRAMCSFCSGVKYSLFWRSLPRDNVSLTRSSCLGFSTKIF